MSVRVSLGNVIRHRSEFIEIDDFEVYKRCRVQVNTKGIILRDKVKGIEIKTKRQQVCNAGEFLVAEIDAKMGGFGIVPPELDGAIVSSHYFLYEVDESVLDAKYLGFYIRTSDFIDQVQAQGSTNYAAIRPHDVLEYTIPLPPLEEQRRIVARIEALATKIEEAKKLRESAIESVDSFVIGLHLNYSGNRVLKVGDFLALDERKQAIEPTEYYPQVGVRGFGGGLFEKESVQGIETTYKFFNKLYPEALVLSQVKGWEGAIAVATKDLNGKFVSPEYRTFCCIPGKANPHYLSEIVTNPWFWMRLKDLTKGMGGRRERTRPELFLEMEIPMPEIEKQEQAVSIFNKLKSTRIPRFQAIREQDLLMPSILDKAFKGELYTKTL